MANQKRIWSKNELTIAYYIAKWDFNGLNISEDSLADVVIKNTTVNSLRMQVANFRYILGIPGRQLTDASQAMYDLANELQNKTIIQVRDIILKLIDEVKDEVERYTVKKHNKTIISQRNTLNEQLRANHLKRLKEMGKFRSLLPKLA